eukprot:m.765879 g.765879  ORF g.765879 m.765879 type:complete len:51 (-) comp23223_c0_seq24:926-1078(-)
MQTPAPTRSSKAALTALLPRACSSDVGRLCASSEPCAVARQWDPTVADTG